jgi:hypothetical protein
MGGSVFAMFHLDHLSCLLTIVATILLARKSWIGLLVAIVNSLIVCAIGLRTSQLGFIPANLFCICVYAFNMRSWLKEQTHTHRDQARNRWSYLYGIGDFKKGCSYRHQYSRSSVLNLTSATKIGLPEEHRAR